jgi:hypothetical protein
MAEAFGLGLDTLGLEQRPAGHAEVAVLLHEARRRQDRCRSSRDRSDSASGPHLA